MKNQNTQKRKPSFTKRIGGKLETHINQYNLQKPVNSR